MRLYVIYRHYWPDNPHFARVLKIVLERLAEDGHEVTVFSAQPSYKTAQKLHAARSETVHGVKIIRMPLPPERRSQLWARAVNAGLFAAGATVYGLAQRKPDLVFLNSAPPFVIAMVARLLRFLRGIPYVYNIQDVHPEAAQIAGVIRSPRLVRWFRRIERNNCINAAKVMTLSEDMARTLRQRGYDGRNIAVVNNFLLPGDDDGNVGGPLVRSAPFVVLYAGNHGKFQGLNHVVDAAHQLQDRPDVHFLFMGDGPVKDHLIEAAGDLVGKTVTFLGHQPWNEALRIIRSADLAVVPIREGMISVSYPSKIITTLAMGTPILTTVANDSALAGFVLGQKLGETTEPDNPGALARAIRRCANRGAPTSMERKRIRSVAQDHFGTNLLLEKWTKEICSAVDSAKSVAYLQ